MTSAAEYTVLEKRILAALREDLSEAEFGELALDVHRFQRRWNEPYAKWCGGRPEAASWRDIPAIPQSMFKAFRISCFSPDETPVTFLTSGTTGETRGAHHFLNTGLYHAAARAGWRRVGRPKLKQVFLVQSPADAPQSSLVSMFGCWAADSGGEFVCDVQGRLDFPRVEALLGGGEPVALFGTALAFLNLFEWLGERHFRLPAGSYALETGGFKGSGREIPKAELYALFEKHLGLPVGDIINEYGMCELSSQFYTSGIGAPHTSGPWLRGVVASPDTGREVAIGETGTLRIFDLANLGSVMALQTGDLAVRREDGFELLGRSPTETPRGCSRMADEMMRGRISFSAPVRGETTTARRIAALATVAEKFPILAGYTVGALRDFVASELGRADALDRFVPRLGQASKAIAPSTILHVLSGNTPAAALQSLTRGLLLGSHNLCKLPSSGLPEVEAFVAALPPELRGLVETGTTLPDEWLYRADAVIVFGNDATIEHFRNRVSAAQTFVAYGHKVSFGVIFDDPDCESAARAARDASIFDQQGCLSPHVFYVRHSPRRYAEALAKEMADFATGHPRGALSVAEAASIEALRQSVQFRAANGADCAVFSGADWMVVFDSAMGFPTTPLNRVIFVKPFPSDFEVELSSVRPHLSACGIEPATLENAGLLADLSVSRICPVGTMQAPPAAWHQDGRGTLAPLVKWVDFESGAPSED